MRVLVVGSEGSMGKRYQAILKYLGHECVKADKEHAALDVVKLAIDCDRVIVCTPTDTHWDVLRSVLLAGKPVLCEKPVTKNLEELKEVIDFAAAFNPMLAMVMQYRYLPMREKLPVITRGEPFYDSNENESYYNYFRHGNDGIVWDCFQIIALANGNVVIREDSPIWDCAINGYRVSLADMDAAYVEMVRDWIRQPYSDLEKLFDLHKKVSEYECKSQKLL